MVINKCPLRISLCGGSTDSPLFIDKYGEGRVISFTPNLYTYSTIHQDVNGFNNFEKKYLLAYSKLETCSRVADIRNEVIRTVLKHFEADPLKISLHADVFSLGSGLASSSSYILNLVSGLNANQQLNMSLDDICQTAFYLESLLNNYNGYQDTYGCAFGGLKLMRFSSGGKVEIENLPVDIFNEFDFYLIYTNIRRCSKSILKSIDITKSYPLLKDVDAMYKCIVEKNFLKLFEILNSSWQTKKTTSPKILGDKTLIHLDNHLGRCPEVLAHKLCGAGGGGYFLAIINKGCKIKLDKPYPYIKISLEKQNLCSYIL